MHIKTGYAKAPLSKSVNFTEVMYTCDAMLLSRRMARNVPSLNNSLLNNNCTSDGNCQKRESGVERETILNEPLPCLKDLGQRVANDDIRKYVLNRICLIVWHC